VELLIKTSSASQFPEACQQLMAAAASDSRIRWLHQLLSTAELDALLLSADALVSLHRSEGFGLVLADAMAIELPVIATGYSGNLEFMPPGSAALVPWQLQPIARTCGDYRQGWLWAEPDLHAAAAAMRRFVEQPAAAQALARRGAAAVRERLSSERLGAIVRQRLGTLLLKPSRRELWNGLPEALRPLG
jgi:glycosyltransferase involved in cell wall biosynthesis